MTESKLRLLAETKQFRQRTEQLQMEKAKLKMEISLIKLLNEIGQLQITLYDRATKAVRQQKEPHPEDIAEIEALRKVSQEIYKFLCKSIGDEGETQSMSARPPRQA
jgi:molecular chaperone GrpE (heat shock protein)